MGQNSEILHIWMVYGIFIFHLILMHFFFELTGQRAFSYSVKQNTVYTLVFNMRLRTFFVYILRLHQALLCVAHYFFTVMVYNIAILFSTNLLINCYFLLSWSITLQYCTPQTICYFYMLMTKCYNLIIH